MQGIIIKGIGGFYYVKTADNTEYECKARGVFRKEGITPMIGDRVEIDLIGNGKASITKIFERSSSLIRPPVANIDSMILVVASTSPEPNIFLIDKMLVNSEISGIRPIICINKSDLTKREDIENIYKTAGYTVITASAENEVGIDELMSLINGKVTAFAGLSGVGKSSLLSLITSRTIETGAVSEKIARGKHTTRHAELIEIEEGTYIVDTPGFSSLYTLDIEKEQLKEYYEEFRECNGGCRFLGCLHYKEPDCLVKEKVEFGEISKLRYENYIQILEEIKEKKKY